MSIPTNTIRIKPVVVENPDGTSHHSYRFPRGQAIDLSRSYMSIEVPNSLSKEEAKRYVNRYMSGFWFCLDGRKMMQLGSPGISATMEEDVTLGEDKTKATEKAKKQTGTELAAISARKKQKERKRLEVAMFGQ
jgi:hypothetical protein